MAMASSSNTGAASTVVVIEIGGSYVRAGIAGESSPRCTLGFGADTSLGSKYPRVGIESSGSIKYTPQSYYLRVVEFMSKIFNVHLPIRPKECAVVVVECMLEARVFRDAVLTVLLKDIQVQNAFLFSSSRLLFSH
jgi:hypothetical protein